MLVDHTRNELFQILRQKFGKSTDQQKSGDKEIKASYSEIKNQVQEMIDKGFEDLDILVAIGEKFPRGEVEYVLSDLRRKGIL